MNRTLRWLHRTRLNREEFNRCLRKKRMEQMDKDYRKYQKRHSPLSRTMLCQYLKDSSISYRWQWSQDDDTLLDYHIRPAWYTDLRAEGFIFDIEGVQVSVKNFVYYVKFYSFRTFTCIRIGDEYEMRNWVEEDIMELIPHLPRLLKQWREEDMIIDLEFLKREKVEKLNALREKILHKTREGQLGAGDV